MDVFCPSSPLEEAPPLARPTAFETLVDLLRWRALYMPERLAFSFAVNADDAQRFTYLQLDQAARALAHAMQQRGLAAGRAVILLQPGADYIIALVGCWYAGITAVPVYAPRNNTSNQRVRLIVQDAQASVVISTASALEAFEPDDYQVQAPLSLVPIDQIPASGADLWTAPAIHGQTLAVLQYTSGSTGAPKGVRLQHRHLLKNSEMIRRAMGHDEHDIGVAWLPPYHDMGLIGSIVQPFYSGYPVHLLAPATFLQRPLRWLEMISSYRATVSAAPNFAYDLCTRRVKPEQLARLDLSHWRLTANGAEPVRQQTLDAFQACFAAAGLRPSAFQPCYGMAETTLLVSAADPARVYHQVAVDREQLKRGRLLRTEAAANTQTLISSGRADRDVTLRIVAPHTLTPLPEGEVGEIWLAGPMVADGYWNNPQATAETFHAHLPGDDRAWLRTGDLGALLDEELFVTGRIKDVIIMAGHNHYPTDIEATVMQAHPAVRPDGVAALALDDGSQEHLALVVELERGWRDLDLQGVRQAIISHVSQHHQLRVDRLVLVPGNTLPKTSSGKIQRALTRELLAKDMIQALGTEPCP